MPGVDQSLLIAAEGTAVATRTKARGWSDNFPNNDLITIRQAAEDLGVFIVFQTYDYFHLFSYRGAWQVAPARVFAGHQVDGESAGLTVGRNGCVRYQQGIFLLIGDQAGIGRHPHQDGQICLIQGDLHIVGDDAATIVTGGRRNGSDYPADFLIWTGFQRKHGQLAWGKSAHIDFIDAKNNLKVAGGDFDDTTGSVFTFGYVGSRNNPVEGAVMVALASAPSAPSKVRRA